MKNLITRLGKRGPHRVMVGDLNFAGIPGRVYTPAEGNGIPGIAFGHDWRVGVDSYHALLRHLASWGFAVAAPDTEKGIAPNHRGFAADLETALQILAGVRLGNGNITVQPNELWLATAWVLRPPCWQRRVAATAASWRGTRPSPPSPA